MPPGGGSPPRPPARPAPPPPPPPPAPPGAARSRPWAAGRGRGGRRGGGRGMAAPGLERHRLALLAAKEDVGNPRAGTNW